MNLGTILRVVMILTGIFLNIVTVISLAKRKMTEAFCLIWALISLALILGGTLLHPYGINSMISATGLFLILMVGFCVVYVAYFITTKISDLSRKSQELAVQVTLLKHENRQLKEQVEALIKEQKNG